MQALLIDLDGVLYVGDQAVPGALDALDWLRTLGPPRLFLTNTTSRPRSAIVEKLARLGFRASADELLTPPVAAAGWLHEQGLRRVGLFLPEGSRSELESFREVTDEAEPVDAVVVGDLGKGWSFEVLNRAFRMLMQDPQPRLLALGMTRYWQAPDGLRLDTAPFVMLLAHAAGVEPIVLGKPAEAFFGAACRLLGSAPGDTVMIGDDIHTDVGGAQDAGLTGLLVRTGKFRDSDLEGEIRPAAVLDSIAELPRWWQEHCA